MRGAWVLMLLLVPPLAQALPQAEPAASTIVGFHGRVEVSELARMLPPGTVLERVLPELQAVVVMGPPADRLSTLLRGDTRVRYVEPDTAVRADGRQTSDPLLADQAHLEIIRAPSAWKHTTGSSSVTLCFLDTGLRASHLDLAGPRLLPGMDLVDGDLDPWDPHGHGTHVAAIAVATLDNGHGGAGVAQASFRAVRVLDAAGGGRASVVAAGISWCSLAGSHIISMSLSGGHATVLADAVALARARGSLLMASAGNSGPCTDCVGYPARFPGVMAVACASADGAPCPMASLGPEVEIAAPGMDILSAWASADHAYTRGSGTSTSVPQVAGAAALVWSMRPDRNADEVRALLRDTAVSGPGNAGLRLVDLDAAVRASSQ